MNLRFHITETISPRLRDVVRALQGSRRAEMNAAAGVEVQKITADHISVLANTRHATAEKYGATPTGFFAQAAEKVAAASALTSSPEEAVLTINHRGFARAFRSVRIAPRTAKSLAIPIHRESYGKRASELWDRLSLFIAKGKRVICATIGGVVTPLYILVGSVTQKQDRSLLPSDDQFRDAAVVGVKGWLKMTLMQGGKL